MKHKKKTQEQSVPCVADNKTDTEQTQENKEVQTSTKTEKLSQTITAIAQRCGFKEQLITRLLGVYLIVSGYNLIAFFYSGANIHPINQWRKFVDYVDMGGTLLMVTGGFLALSLIHYLSPPKWRIMDKFALFAGTVFFSGALMWRSGNYYLCIAAIIISSVFMCYLAGRTSNDAFEKIPDWVSAAVIFAAAAAVAAFVSVTSLMHHKSFGTSCYDIGIFAQMYHNMDENWNMETTCERDTPLSHIKVHASFIYWLLLPVYKLFPSVDTLLISQAIIVMLGVVPLFLIARNHHYKGFALTAICLVYVLYPGFIGPCYYDFHENAFLPVLLMWLLYAVDKRNYLLFYIMSVLVCIVKEDAPLFVICIGLYLLCSEKGANRFHGLIVTGLAGLYFTLMTQWLNENGDGAFMASSRFSNLTTDSTVGFSGIAANVLANPAYFVSILTDEERFIYFVQVMLPLLFLPFMTKKLHRFILIIPYVIMNLVIGSSYLFASMTTYQYMFGTPCLLIYMMLLNCKDMSKTNRNMAVLSSALACMLSSVCLFSVNIRFAEDYIKDRERFQAMEAYLDTVPEDASVACHTWYLPHMTQRSEIYIFDNSDLLIDEHNDLLLAVKDTERYDFIVLNMNDKYMPEAALKLLAEGFTEYGERVSSIGIFKSPYYTEAE